MFFVYVVIRVSAKYSASIFRGDVVFQIDIVQIFRAVGTPDLIYNSVTQRKLYGLVKCGEI
jgi:hypothetical protein